MCSRIRRLTLVGALAVMAASSACSSDREAISQPRLGDEVTGATAAPTPDPQIRTVAMVGDSITVGAQPQLESTFAGLGLDVRSIDAQEGRRIVESSSDLRSGLDAAAGIAADTPPRLWVIALGTNDLPHYAPSGYELVISALLAELPADAPVVWVDVYNGAAIDATQEFNTALSAVLGDRPGAVVAPWSAVAGGDGVVVDGVHPGESGKAQFANTVADAVTALGG